jgi:hypothetical protein
MKNKKFYWIGYILLLTGFFIMLVINPMFAVGLCVFSVGRDLIEASL